MPVESFDIFTEQIR